MVSPVAQTKETILRQSSANSPVDSDDDGGKTENYESLNLIGTGAYGSVYKYLSYHTIIVSYSILRCIAGSCACRSGNW